MKIIVIGLGGFGRGLADELTNLGHEVIGVDHIEHSVEMMRDRLSGAFILDTTDDKALSMLPLNDVDVVIVAVGRDFATSIKTVSLLKNRKLNARIYARSFDEMHTAVLKSMGITNILRPEADAATMYAKRFNTLR